jgi:curved DNA-binding protein CbpA
MGSLPVAGEDGAAGTAGPGSAGAGVELPPEMQREIRDLARVLPDLDHYGVLGISRDATPEAIRAAFFSRSKKFHPDRYFRKKLGPFGPLLHEIYKRVAVAHDVLRSVELRAEYDRSRPLAAGKVEKAAPEAPAAPADAPPAAAPAVPPKPQRARGSLRARAGVRPPDFALRSLERQLALGREKAERCFAQATDLRLRGHFEGAADALRNALALAPRERRYEDALAEVLPRANDLRASRALERSRLLLDRGATRDALPYLEEAAELRPTDSDLATQVATLLLDVGGSATRAADFAARAVELAESSALCHKVLARALRAGGKTEEARRALERAVALDPKDREARAELSAL